uniref:G-protein coupled receptors family 1 profile domain-containing protein n=1 Tax=Ascaris lumbricoides TaxID=6252 RepID=A0A9J2PDC1_ASCLU
MDPSDEHSIRDEERQYTPEQISYIIESAIYALAMILGFGACVYTARRGGKIFCSRFHSHYRRHVILAARLMSFKISLTVADLVVLFVYAPTQIIWISTYNWYGGDFLCRTTKFINTFSLHLTANMQVLIAADRLYITAHLREVHQKSGFAANQMIATAWLFAITCALPQLFVFHVYYLPDGKPQCVSIWTVLRYRELLNMEANAKQYFDENSTLIEDYFEELMPRNEVGAIDQNFLDDNSELLKFLEHAYNLLHLFSICILPYSIELFCYALILVLMKRVNSDIRNSDCPPKRRGVLFCCTRGEENLHSKHSSNYCTELTNDWSAESRLVKDRMIVFVDQDVRSTLLTTDVNTSRALQRDPSENHLRVSGTDLASTCNKSTAAWKNTVALARRKTRRKAFLMLTLNMIFWTPYCIMGMLSTIMIFDHSAYNFVNALVVLNAVSNLFL